MFVRHKYQVSKYVRSFLSNTRESLSTVKRVLLAESPPLSPPRSSNLLYRRICLYVSVLYSVPPCSLPAAITSCIHDSWPTRPLPKLGSPSHLGQQAAFGKARSADLQGERKKKDHDPRTAFGKSYLFSGRESHFSDGEHETKTTNSMSLVRNSNATLSCMSKIPI